MEAPWSTSPEADGAEAARVDASLRAGLAGFDTVDLIGRGTDGTPTRLPTPPASFDVPPTNAGDVTLELVP
jgi:hypothetical protein